MLPWCNPEAVTKHPGTVSAQVQPGSHAALLVDQAGLLTSIAADRNKGCSSRDATLQADRPIRRRT